jgi:site-specific recombinase XerD
MPKDLDREAGWITVRHGKGDKERIVAMGSLAWDDLERWLAIRRAHKVGSRSPVFCTLMRKSFGEPLSQPYVRGMLKRKARQAGFDDPGRVHAHALRHAFAVEHHRSGEPLDHLRRLLGHGSLAVTLAYLARIDPSEALESAQSLGTPEPPSEIEQLRREVAELRRLIPAIQ